MQARLGLLQLLQALRGVHDGVDVAEEAHGVAHGDAAAPVLLQAARLRAHAPARVLQAPLQLLHLRACTGPKNEICV